MIASSSARDSPVLREPVPERCLRPRLEGVGADSNDSKTSAGVAAGLARFHEKIDATFRPRHATGTIGWATGTSQSLFQREKQGIKSLEVVKSRHRKRVEGSSRANLSFSRVAILSPRRDALSDRRARFNLRSTKFPCLLQVQPKLRRRPEIPRESQRRVGAHTALAVKDRGALPRCRAVSSAA